MPTPVPGFIERLERQRDGALATIDGILERLNDDDREPTEIEQQTLTDARQTLERSQTQQTEWTELLETRAGGDEIRNRVHGALARSGQAQGARRVERDPAPLEVGEVWRSAGEYAADFVVAHGHDLGFGSDRDYDRARQRFERAASARLERADQTTADNLGVLPTPILGPVVTFLPTVRPFLGSIAARPMPASGKTFSRPVVSQHTTVAPQSTEKTALASQKMTINALQVTKGTYGGTLDISFQDRDWTDPAILQIVFEDLAAEYAFATDAAACTAFKAAVTTTIALADATQPAAWLGAIYSAAASIAASTANRLPDTLWVSTDVWRALGMLSDTQGRPLFPVLGPINADGTMQPGEWAANPFGLRLIVDNNLGVKTAIVGLSTATEYYEQIGGLVSVTEPSILGYQVAYYGYFAAATPAPSAFRSIVITTMPAAAEVEGLDEPTPEDEPSGGVTGGRARATR
jgi:HK97 family phage major capsid protein